MLTPGDVVELDLGTPRGSEAGLRRPAIVITAERILRGRPKVIQVVPLTRTIRETAVEVVIEPDEHNGLTAVCAAQCQHIRSVAMTRVGAQIGNVGSSAREQIRAVVALIIDAPSWRSSSTHRHPGGRNRPYAFAPGSSVRYSGATSSARKM